MFMVNVGYMDSMYVFPIPVFFSSQLSQSDTENPVLQRYHLFTFDAKDRMSIGFILKGIDVEYGHRIHGIGMFTYIYNTNLPNVGAPQITTMEPDNHPFE